MRRRREAIYAAGAILIAALLAVRAGAQSDGIGLPLRAVRLETDAWVDQDGLRDLLPLTVGEPLTEDQLAESRRILELADVFREIDVNTHAEGGEAVVVFSLKRRRIVTDVSVTGYNALRWRDVFRLLRLRSGAFYDPDAVRAAEERLRTRYRQIGYPHAQVGSHITQRPGEAQVDFAIDEGKPLKVVAVVVTGDTGLPARELERALRSLVGKPNRRNAARDGERILLSSLRRANYYDADITSDWVPSGDDEGVLWFTVDAGQPTNVVITGNESRTEVQLLGLMDLEIRLIITDGTWRELSRRMTRYYQEAGYYRVRVRLKIEDGPPRTVEFRIDEGRPYFVRRVDFAGNTLPATELRKRMNTQPAGLLPWPRLGAFVRPVFDEDLRRIWFYYREQGFEDAEIVDAPVDVNDTTGNIDVTVVVDEGPRTIIEALHLPDLTDLPPAVPTPVFKLARGEPLKPPLLEADTREIRRALHNGGYTEATVEPVVTRRNEGDVAPALVDWKVTRGTRHLVGDIIVQGNVETINATVVRELPFTSGDPLDPEALRRGQDQVYQLGTYRSVSVEPMEQNPDTLEPSVEPTHRDEVVQDVGVAVVPRPPGSLQWGAGYNTRDGITGFGEITYDNLGHAARRLTLRGQGSVIPDDASQTQFLALIGYRQRRFLDSDWQWNTELIGERSTKTIDQFDVLRGSLGNGVIRDVLPRLKFGAELQLEYADVFNVQPISFRGEDEGTSFTTALSPSLTFDGRNDQFAPTSGIFDSLRFRYAPPGLCSVQFGKLNLQHSQAFPLIDWLSFIYTARLGYGRAFTGATVLPIRERYFLGGSTTVRGFAENSLGPVDQNGTVIGGDLAMVLSLEWRVPIIYQLSAAVFNDNGGLFLTQCDHACRQQHDVHDDAFTLANFRHSAGPGLRYMTPVGPISLDYGFKLDRRAGESIGEVHFSISGTF